MLPVRRLPHSGLGDRRPRTSPDGTYDNGYDVTLTNPGPKTTRLYLQSEVQQNQYTVDGGGTIIFCPALDGSLLRAG
jgi:hypothetical protein